MGEQEGSIAVCGTKPAESSSSSSSCEECKTKASKYKCPGCSVRSCSLPCVKAHKQRTGCTGKRQQQTHFVPLSQFDNNLLLSDYNMLEDLKRVADSAKRMRVQLCGEFLYRSPFHLRNLLKAARSRRIQLLFLPKGMSKRETNQTHFNNRSKLISWTIEWRFQSTDIKLLDHGVNEDSNLYSVIEKHLQPGPRNHPLKPFCLEPLESLKIFISEHPKKWRSPLRELDMKAPIREQLTKLVIIEYPVLHVVLPSRSSPRSEAVQTDPSLKEPVVFREEEIKDDDSADPRVLDLMNQSNGKTETQQQFVCDSTELGTIDLMDFDFEPELMDVYSNLMSDDFLHFDGLIKQELEEGEIADSD